MKRVFAVSLILAMLVLSLAGCKKEPEPEPTPEPEPEPAPSVPVDLPQLQGPSAGDTIAVFETSKGTFKAVLYPEYAPKAVENFIAHANNSYYADMIFHRVVEGFVVQTGDPTGTGGGGESALGAPFENEYSNNLHHFTGALGMANAAENQNKSQFYVVQGGPVSDDLIAQMEQAGFDQEVIDGYKQRGGQPTLDNRYTVFGYVYEGMDVVNEIAKVKVENERPKKDVELISVTIETYAAPANEGA